MNARVTIFDTTLRDGEQSPGCSMHTAEKVRMALQLERLGVDIIEAGFPIASPGDFEAVQAISEAVRGARVAALCRAKAMDIEAAGKALEEAVHPVIHTFLATSGIHLKWKLRITPEEALKQAVEGVRLARTFCDEVEFSAEDASRSDYGYLREILQAVFEAGARTLNVPDTVGYALPPEYADMVRKLVRDIPGAVISVHCHNDLGLAVANSLAAVQAGARQVECTINGIGERAGNTSLEELVMALKVRREVLQAETGVRSELLVPTSTQLSTVTGVWPQPNKAVVGRNAFAHEAGIHQHGMLANPLCYEIMTPASVGLSQSMLILGKHSGKHAVESRLKQLGIAMKADEIEDVTRKVKELADRTKFVYDEDLLSIVEHTAEPRARLVRYQVVAGNQILPTATVEVEVEGHRRTASAVGNGPLDAAMKAADAALGFELQLLEMHTRAVTAGKDALAEVTVRVVHDGIESLGQAASTDTIEATLKAYLSAVAAARAARAPAGPGQGAGERTLLDKIWDAHLVAAETEATPAVLYVDLHLVHEVTSPQAFAELRSRARPVRRPERTVATMDHAIPTRSGPDGRRAPAEGAAAEQVSALEKNCREFGVTLYPVGDERQGIVHVTFPELGLTHPGSTIVCGDSHTSTHGAFGALAFGIGTSEVGHVLATQCLLQRKPKAFAVQFDGTLAEGVTAKDLILALIARIGTGGATGHALEYRGSGIGSLSMEERMTVCNMSIEAGARAGLVAPDDTTCTYLSGRPFAPKGAAWDAAVSRWRTLPSDDGAVFDRVETIDASALEPMITWGTSPGMGIPVRGAVPEPNGDAGLEKALRYMGLEPGKPLLGRKVDVVFIGSCTNSRLSDLRDAARVLRGRKVAPGVRALVVPGSEQVKKQAESEGLDRVFREAGAEWREAGCSMCLAMNDDRLQPGQYAVSTSNRNFEGRQGPGGRTFLASPLTAAASAVAGAVADAREVLS